MYDFYRFDAWVYRGIRSEGRRETSEVERGIRTEGEEGEGGEGALN